MSKVISNLGVTIPENTCNCWVHLYYDYVSHTWSNGGGIKFYKEGCLGASVTWQYLDFNVSGTTWQNLLTTDPGFISDTLYDPNVVGARGTGLYRIKAVVPNCGEFYSNLLETYLA